MGAMSSSKKKKKKNYLSSWALLLRGLPGLLPGTEEERVLFKWSHPFKRMRERRYVE